MMKSIVSAALLGASVLVSAPALAGPTTIAIEDITTHPEYTVSNTGQTYTGTGFVGMYSDNEFNHLFGVEGGSSSTTAQIDISGFHGSVGSAVISFDILNGGGGPYPVTITGSAGTGTLAYDFDGGPADYGSVTSGVNMGGNSFDITAIVNAALAANEDWLDLHFQATNGGDCCLYTYTNADFGGNADSANLRLTIDGSGAVPEPASWALMLGGFGMIGGAMRSRKRTAVSFG